MNPWCLTRCGIVVSLFVGMLLASNPGLAESDKVAGNCNLDVHFGPVSFENEPPVTALRKILAGTGISLVESGEFDAGTISAQDVSGTVGEAVRRLAEGTGLQYVCRNGVMRVSQQPHRPVASAATVAQPLSLSEPSPVVAVEANSANRGVTPAQVLDFDIHEGDSLKSRLIAFAHANHYQVSWSGDDLLAKQDARFVGSNFEEVVNRFLLAAKITGYLSKDEGEVLNVFVR